MRRRRSLQREETADQRLDRLIEEELKARRTRSVPPEREQERRVSVEGEPKALRSAMKAPPVKSGAGQATAGGNAEASRTAEHFWLQFGPLPSPPGGMLAPLFQGRQDRLREELGARRQDEHRPQERPMDRANCFWSPEVRRLVASGTAGGGHPGVPAEVPRMAGRAEQAPSMVLRDEDIELMRLRVIREAEENFMREVRKIRGEGDTKETKPGSYCSFTEKCIGW